MTRFIFLLMASLALRLAAADNDALVLSKTISLPGVQGRIDHFALDAQGQRLFVAALGNDTVEVIDLAAGERVHSIGDCSKPQGLAFVPKANRLFIANGGSGKVNMLDGADFKVLKSLADLPNADNVRYDAAENLIYVGYGDGALAIIGATNGELIAKIPLAAHPESFQLEKNGNRIFVNVPDAKEVAVIDRRKREVIAKWHWEKFEANFPMALDETHHRLFIGCRHPAPWIFVVDAETGRLVKVHSISSDVDDLYFDAKRDWIYASCGGGFLDIVHRDADNYETVARIPTASGARTSFFWPERDELYLAERAGLISGDAEIRVFRCGEKN